MGEKINIENIKCFCDCYQIDFRFEESRKIERCYIRKDALMALITVAEKEEAIENVHIYNKPMNLTLCEDFMNEQDQLKEFKKDMVELYKCAKFQQSGDRLLIQCKLGLWSVDGTSDMTTINEAMRYFEQYKNDGEYADLLGREPNAPTDKPLS